ncbi:hypothetical protein QJS66_09585 [Kocuria rhizophila]|nr:hypothetical protein QJS66_09585 [Kocuria rhizophila]
MRCRQEQGRDREEYGEEQLTTWRRSDDTPPPELDDPPSGRRPGTPATRTRPACPAPSASGRAGAVDAILEEQVVPYLKAWKNRPVAAHGNSRAPAQAPTDLGRGDDRRAQRPRKSRCLRLNKSEPVTRAVGPSIRTPPRSPSRPWPTRAETGHHRDEGPARKGGALVNGRARRITPRRRCRSGRGPWGGCPSGGRPVPVTRSAPSASRRDAVVADAR